MRFAMPWLRQIPRLRPLAIAAALGVALAVPAAGDRNADSRSTDAGPEPLIAKILDELSQRRLESALRYADQLTAEYPSFRLGHLIRGDLLHAKTRPLHTIGAVNAPADRLAALRDEARARIAAYAIKPPAETMPRQILRLSPEHRHALLIDTRRSRLYLYANDGPVPRLVSDYYVSQGRAGADKFREGDLRTPLGIYHVTEFLPPQKLTDFYGSGAFPINYPNRQDRLQGRTGHGIWLHGTPPDTYSRPPRASEGCVVLANPDFEALALSVQAGATPVVIADGIDWISEAEWRAERDSLAEAIDSWRRDWESRNADRYLRHYAPDFRTDTQNRSNFAAAKRTINASKEWIRVTVDNLELLTQPGSTPYVIATFDQDYRSSNLSNRMRKEQHWQRRNGRWQIIYEGNA